MNRNLYQTVGILLQCCTQDRRERGTGATPRSSETAEQNIFVEIPKTYVDGFRSSSLVFRLELHDLQVAAVGETVRFEILAGREILYLRRIGNVFAFIHHLERGRIRTVRCNTRPGRRQHERVHSLHGYRNLHRIRPHVIVGSFEFILARGRGDKRMDTLRPCLAARLIDDGGLSSHVVPVESHRESGRILTVVDNGFLIHGEDETRNGSRIDLHLIGLLAVVRGDELVAAGGLRRKLASGERLAGRRIGNRSVRRHILFAVFHSKRHLVRAVRGNLALRSGKDKVLITSPVPVGGLRTGSERQGCRTKRITEIFHTLHINKVYLIWLKIYGKNI